MTSLDEVVGSVLTHINRGRTYADMASIEIAQQYRKDPMLSHFPVPHLTIDEIEIELRVAFSQPPVRPVHLTQEMQSDVLTFVRGVVRELPRAAPVLSELSEQHSKWQALWKQREDSVIEQVGTLIPVNVALDPDSTARAVASMIESDLTGTLIDQRGRVPVAVLRTYQKQAAPRVRHELYEQVHEVLRDKLEVPGVGDQGLQVLITATELQALSPERISTVKFTVHESDRVWAQLDDDDVDDDGATRSTLVPH